MQEKPILYRYTPQTSSVVYPDNALQKIHFIFTLKIIEGILTTLFVQTKAYSQYRYSNKQKERFEAYDNAQKYQRQVCFQYKYACQFIAWLGTRI